MKKILTIFTICLSLIATSCMNIFDKDELKQKNTITFDGNGGKTASGETRLTQVFDLGVAQNLLENPFTHTDASLNFAGWAESSSATSPTYANKASISIKEDRTFYAVWTSINQAMYIDGTAGSDSYDGSTAGNAYKSFTPVLNKIQSAPISTLEWTVYVVNPVDSNVVIPALNAEKLIIKSTTATTSLATVTSGSVLTVSSGAKVQLESITVTGGKPSSASQILLGGGVHNEGTLIVEADTTIKNNEATYGGGIYNTGTLVVNGGSITLNKVTQVSFQGDGGGIYTKTEFNTTTAQTITTNNEKVTSTETQTNNIVYNPY